MIKARIQTFSFFIGMQCMQTTTGKEPKKRSTICERYCFLVRWQTEKRWTNTSNDFQPKSLSGKKRLYLSIFALILVQPHKKHHWFFKKYIAEKLFYFYCETNGSIDSYAKTHTKREIERAHNTKWQKAARYQLKWFDSISVIFHTYLWKEFSARFIISSCFRFKSFICNRFLTIFNTDAILNNVRIIENETERANWIFNDCPRHYVCHNKSTFFSSTYI